MDSTQLLSTGDVARLLGFSRQHVVDMCDRGDLRCVRAGTHRRVPQAAVDELLDTANRRLGREQERSLWLHRVVTAALVTEPDATLTKARQNLAAWKGVHRLGGMSERWLRQWAQLLDRGVDQVAEILTSRSEHAVQLRQNSPFAGVLPPEVRARVLISFARHWREDHGVRRVT